MKKRLLALFLTFVILFGVLAELPVVAASSPTWKMYSVSNLSETDAKISGKITFSSKMQFSAGGFYIGTSKTNMHKNAYPDSTTTKSKTISFNFLMSKYKEQLYPGTTYYYQIYVVSGGKTYKSPTYSFKTKGTKDTPVWSNTSPTNITFTNATLNAKASFAKSVKITKGGVYFGTSKTNLKKIAVSNMKNSGKSFKASVNLNKIGQKLKKDTTYYYRLSLTVDGVKTYTTAKSFRTEPDATKITFPLPTNKVWYASTYVGHGGDNKSAYSSVDITLKNGKSAKGYAVYSMADGVVWNDTYAKSNGQITIKYTTTLITTNGKKYTTWYASYAHMTNITVKKGQKVKAGQQIGKVGSVGKSSGPHLHLSIGSGNGGTGWYQEKTIDKAISPYYIYGFVTADEEDTAYLVRDKKGTGVTNQLINHKPTGK